MITSSTSTENFPERLRFWRVSLNLNQTEAARQLDIDRSYYSQLERGRAPGNALRTRFLLLEKFAAIEAQGGAMGRGLRNVPVLGWSQAAALPDLKESIEVWEDTVPSDVIDPAAFAVRLRGDSMEPKFSNGDIAVLLPGVVATNGDTVIANLRDEGVVCRIMQVQSDPNLIMLSSYNPAYLPMERARDRFHWILPVGSVLKQLRRG